MEQVIGLDLGSNSVGWSLIAYDNHGNFQAVKDAGSRILPINQLKNNFEQGQSISINSDRRFQRMQRRLKDRDKLRRKHLLTVFEQLNANPGFAGEAPPEGSEQYTDLQLYRLKRDALYHPVSLVDLARITYHINQRRGYFSNRREKRQQDSGTKQAEFITLAIIEEVTPTGEKKGKKTEYAVALASGDVAYTTDETFSALQGEEREIKITKSINKQGAVTSVKASLPAEDDWNAQLARMERELAQQQLHPSEYFLQKMEASQARGHRYRIKDHLIYRERYIQEFNAIWDQQVRHHPELKDEALKQRIIEAVVPRHYPEKRKWLKRDLKTFIRDFIIFYQRPLKSQKGRIDTCFYEPWKKVVPKSHPLFQEFRVWSTINNLILEDDEGHRYPLTSDVKADLFEYLQYQVKVTHKAITKQLKLKEPWSLRAPDEIPGNATKAAIAKAFKDADADIEQYLQTYEDWRAMWHILYSHQTSEKGLQKALRKQFGIDSQPLQESLARTYFAQEFGNLSHKALLNLLPLMRAGRYFEVSAIPAAVITKIDNLLNDQPDDGIKDSTYQKFLGELLVQNRADFQGLQYNEAASLAYGEFRQTVEKTWTAPDRIPKIQPGELKNPVVEQVGNEALEIVKAIWERYGKPDRIRVEFARELTQSAQERQNRTKNMRNRQKEREKAEETIRKDPDFGIQNPKRKDIERYLLWKESGMYCIYTGKTIPKTALFNGETDVDHIIPKERFFDDSFANRVICYQDANREKGNYTAYEYMSGQDWERYEEDVKKTFNGLKRHYLLTDKIPDSFLNRQMSQTRYISTEVRRRLDQIKDCEVELVPGQVTDYLKNEWQLNETFKELLKPRYERMEQVVYQGKRSLMAYRNTENGSVLDLENYSKRLDHRHHALDAIVTGVTRYKDVMTLARLNKYGAGARHIQPPKLPDQNEPFHQHVKAVLSRILVSHKDKKQLVTQGLNRYYKRDGQTGKKLLTEQPNDNLLAVRRPLHDQQPYGRITRFKKVAIKEAMKDPDRIKESWQRDLVKERLNAYQQDVKKAAQSLKNAPLYRPNGKPLNTITIYEHHYAKTHELKAFTGKSPKALDQIADLGLQADIKAHVREFGGALTKAAMAEAFQSANIERFNQKRNSPVHKVTLIEPQQNLEALDDERWVYPGENYCIVVNNHNGVSLRAVTNLEALEHFKQGGTHNSLLTERGDFSLWAYEMVYVPRPGEAIPDDPSEVSQEALAERTYVFRKNSNKQMYFLPHCVADPVFRSEEYGTQDMLQFIDTDNPRTKIINRFIKLYIDRLGHLISLL
jgi:CRISPR/Cas system Type II protein with McrA/HNH and RuvC-like nuclease domain